MKKVALIGANGMFGRDAHELMRSAGYEVTVADLPDLDITVEDSLARFFSAGSYDIVVNAAGWTDVDGAESHKEEAFKVNAFGVRLLAEKCASSSSLLVHISSDYVFPGKKPGGYFPDDTPGPALNTYGQSKLAGEVAVLESLPQDRYLICRTQWLFGAGGKNFVQTIRNLASTRDEIKVVEDQWGAPTWTVDLAAQVISLMGAGARGIAHTVCAGGPASWYDFATEIVKRCGYSCKVEPCSSREFPRPAPRPSHAWLTSHSSQPCKPMNWREALGEYIGRTGA